MASAAAVMAALDHPESAGRVLPLGGGERITAGEMFARVRRSLAVTNIPQKTACYLAARQRIAAGASCMLAVMQRAPK